MGGKDKGLYLKDYTSVGMAAYARDLKTLKILANLNCWTARKLKNLFNLCQAFNMNMRL